MTTLDKANLQAFIKDVEDGYIKLNVSQTFSLSEIAEAHRLMDSNTATGKIVVVIEH